MTMCMIDNVDGNVEVLSKQSRTAFKEHVCDECARKIGNGEKYQHTAYTFDGKFDAHNICSHCLVSREWLVRECGGWCYTGVQEDLYDHWKEDGIRTMELGRILVGMRRKWKDNKGNLMALPTVREAVLA